MFKFSFLPLKFLLIDILLYEVFFSLFWFKSVNLQFYFPIQDRKALGITGSIRFDRDYKTREEFHMDIVEYNRVDRSFKKVSEWNPIDRLIVTRSFEELLSQKAFNIQNKVFSVVSKIGMPYLELVENGTNLHGNDRYEGFVKDLMDEIARLKNFTYKLYLVHGNHNGAHDHVTGKWNGIVGDILEGVRVFEFSLRKTYVNFIYFEHLES